MRDDIETIRKRQSLDATGTGRVISTPDERDQNFMLHRTSAAPERRQKYWPLFTPILDQGRTSECVIYSCDYFLSTLPVVNEGFKDPAVRTRIYKQVQKMDEWPGENYDGTSVRAMMKWLKANGYISQYRWAFEAAPVVQHLLTTGPVLMGTAWTIGMFMPDRWGYIAPGADQEIRNSDSGHAYELIGVNLDKVHPLTGEKGAVRGVNSWGKGWGQKGRFWMTISDLNRLIKYYGEAAVPIEVKKT